MYTFSSRVRYSEIDASGNISLNAIINYFQDCTTFHSEDVGKGILRLKEEHKVWMLSSWQIVIEKYPVFGQNIIIGTQPYDFKGMLGFRNFVIMDENRYPVVKANSIWCLLDTDTGRPIRVSEEDAACYGTGEKLDMEYADRKIAIPAGGKEMEPFFVRPHQIDTNHHVNNGEYVLMAREYLPEGCVIRQVRAEYKRQAVLGDKMLPTVIRADNGYVVVLNNENNSPYAVVEFVQESEA
ncbi:MAG: acyl-[acyl-carrier-protein] thioesterase [Lachnospiraceae bacterium]|nr:acyl-[acyl-carrier-protein] thioesterase [Candidatus Fimimorpha excrementavium]